MAKKPLFKNGKPVFKNGLPVMVEVGAAGDCECCGGDIGECDICDCQNPPSQVVLTVPDCAPGGPGAFTLDLEPFDVEEDCISTPPVNQTITWSSNSGDPVVHREVSVACQNDINGCNEIQITGRTSQGSWSCTWGLTLDCTSETNLSSVACAPSSTLPFLGGSGDCECEATDAVVT